MEENIQKILYFFEKTLRDGAGERVELEVANKWDSKEASILKLAGE